MRRLGACGLVVVMLASLAGAAPKESDQAQAKRLYEEGTASYNLGEFADAIDKYKAGYKLKHEPLFLLNIAQAYRLSNNHEQALFFYKSFLNAKPDAKNKDEIDQRIAEMEKLIADTRKPDAARTTDKPMVAPPDKSLGKPIDQPPAKPPAKPVVIPPPDQVAAATEPQPAPRELPADGARPIYKKWWFWTGLGAVAVGATVAVVVLSSGGASAPSADFHGKAF